MKRLSLAFLLLSGCLSNNSLDSMAMASNNISNLSRISVGMTQPEVMQIMHRPYTKETIVYQDDTFDFWFYVTRPTGLDQGRMTPQNLIPLTFKNGVLIGWGFNYYNHLVKAEKNNGNSAQKPTEAEEDLNLEKALETPASSKKQKSDGAYPPSKQPSKPAAPQPKKPPKQAPPGQSKPNQGAQSGVKSEPLELGPPPSAPQKSTSFSIKEFFDRFTIAQSEPASQEIREKKKKGEGSEETQQDNTGDKKKEFLDDEDRHMIETENEQNFDFW